MNKLLLISLITVMVSVCNRQKKEQISEGKEINYSFSEDKKIDFLDFPIDCEYGISRSEFPYYLPIYHDCHHLRGETNFVLIPKKGNRWYKGGRDSLLSEMNKKTFRQLSKEFDIYVSNIDKKYLDKDYLNIYPYVEVCYKLDFENNAKILIDSIVVENKEDDRRSQWEDSIIDLVYCEIDKNGVKSMSLCSDDWYDIFYLYPFKGGDPDEIGTYYIEIEKDKTSKFATSFGHRGEGFDYTVIPKCKNDTLYVFNYGDYEILAKITKVGNDYYVDSEYIKVFTDEIKKEKYGYKVKKGFPDD